MASSLADQTVWDELTDEQRESIRRLVRDGLGPAKGHAACSECGWEMSLTCVVCDADA